VPANPTPEVDVEQLAGARDRAVVVDVREPFEYVGGHVPGAVPMPMAQLPHRVGELDRGTPVFVICATGNRSRPVADLLRRRGYEAWSVAGGTSAWVRSGRPVEGGAR